MTLTACTDLSPADWVTTSELPWGQLVEFGPSGFEAYARLRLLPDPAHDGQSEIDVETPDTTLSETEQLGMVFRLLADHTRTPDECYFCVWDGWGSGIYGYRGRWVAEIEPAPVRLRRAPLPGASPGSSTTAQPGLAPSFASSPRPGARVLLRERAYFLFSGSVAELDDWGVVAGWPGGRRLGMPDPAFVWPADHAWCVARDVDPHWAGIGAAAPAVDRLLGDPRLDVVPADPDEPQPHYR